MQRLSILIGVYREENKPERVLVTHNQDYTLEQHHLLSTEHLHPRVPVSQETIIECLTKIVSRIIERSIYSNASTEAAAHKQHQSEFILSGGQLDRDTDAEQWYEPETAQAPQTKAG